MTLAKTRDAPPCHTRTVPERSAQNSRPSGANARAVAKLAGIVPLGVGSFDGAAHASAVGDGVPVTGCAVGVVRGVALAVGRGLVDPQAAASTARPARGARRRIPLDRSADSDARLSGGIGGGDDVE